MMDVAVLRSMQSESELLPGWNRYSCVPPRVANYPGYLGNIYLCTCEETSA